MVDLFQSLDNRFFHDRLDIGRAEELTLDGVCLRYPELSVFRDKFLPLERFCRFKEFIVRLGVDLSYFEQDTLCLLYTSPSPRDRQKSRMPSSA